MPASATTPAAHSKAKRGALTGAALSDEVLDSSPSVLRPVRGAKTAVTGLQQFFSPPEAAKLIAAVNGRSLSTFDPTAGDGSLLAAIDPDFRFGVEIDADQLKAGGYEAIHGDLQLAYPLLRLLGTKFPRIACNPPFGLDWSLNGRRENSTLATWRIAVSLLAHDGAGAFIAGRDRFAREVMGRPDAAGIYALVECEDLFERVELPCTIAFFVPAEAAETPRSGGPLRLTAERDGLLGLAEEIRAECDRVVGFVPEPLRCRFRASLVDRFETVGKELERRRKDRAAQRQKFDLALKGNRISARPSPFARLALQQRRLLRNVERLIALRWKDVDWKASLIRVRRNYTRGRFGTPKSKRSSRAVPMPERVAAALKQQFERSSYTGADDLVFCHPETGGPFDSSKMRKRFKAALKAAGVRSIRFHDLRHTFGTRMAAAGAPLRTIQEWMGHRDHKTTEIYADYAPDPVQGARWAEAAFADEEAEEDGDATDDENDAS